MNYKVIDINIDYKKANAEHYGYQPTMTLYLPDNLEEVEPNLVRPTVIVCPGGGYHFTSKREGEPIALKLISAGLNAVVVHYSCAPARFPCQLLELSSVVAKVRENAEEWNVDTNKIVVMGFSAGGHLAASYGTLWNKDFIKEYFGFNNGENKVGILNFIKELITFHGVTGARILFKDTTININAKDASYFCYF